MTARRIALVSDHASPLAVLGGADAGGQNVYVAETARLLAADGDQVDVFTRRDAPHLPDVVTRDRNVRVIHLDAGPAADIAKEDLLPHMPAFTAGLVDWCERGAYDLVHAHFFMSALAGLEVRRRFGIPLVVTFHALGRVRRLHQGAADRFPPERTAIEDVVVATADRIVAECPQDHDDLVALYGADPARLTTIPCGYDPDELWPVPRRVARARLGLEPNAFVLLQLGRMVPRKGIDTVVEAVGILRQRYGIDAVLLVAGGSTPVADEARTPEIRRLRRIAEEGCVADRVRFVGRRERDELRTYYSAADLFITTPWYEPFGITPIEAMACGTPVIGSSVGGVKYTVVDGVTGCLVRPRDADALAARIAHLHGHPELRARYGRAAVQRAQGFTWHRVAADLARLYEEVLTSRLLSPPTEAWRSAPRNLPTAADGPHR